MAKATFGAGCFWGVEAELRDVDGVLDTRVGYAGGEAPEPSYEQVCSGATGHAEVVEVSYDPERVGYEELLEVFWRVHDPTQVNRQGPDVGSQYRSVILVHDEEQRQVAERARAELDRSDRFEEPIATEITDAEAFWEAEDYHQRYFERAGKRSPHALVHKARKAVGH